MNNYYNNKYIIFFYIKYILYLILLKYIIKNI